MSIISLLVAAKNAWADRRRRSQAYAELISLDDRSLADIGIHRSQIPGIVEGLGRGSVSVPASIAPAANLGRILGGSHRPLAR